jgi:regulatory protein YycH of two-component signal transduction system YycFG
MEEKVLVPRVIYESIENVLEAQVRKLAIDIAKTLNVNEKLLLQELKKDKISVLLLDESTCDDVDSLHCKAYDKYEHVYLPCEQPVLYKKEFCMKHITTHVLKSHIESFTCLTKLVYETNTYYRDTNNIVYDSNFNKIGYYKPSSETIIHLVVAGEDGQ